MGSDYSASVSSVPSSSRSCLTVLLRCSASFSVRCLFTSSRLISHPFIRLSVLGLLFVSFRPSLLRSHSRSTSAYFRFRFHIFPFFSAFFRPLLFRFRLLSLPFLPFLLFLASPHGGSSSAWLFLSVLPIFFRSSWLISRSVFPVLSTRFSVGFLSFYPASLPQLFHR